MLMYHHVFWALIVGLDHFEAAAHWTYALSRRLIRHNITDKVLLWMFCNLMHYFETSSIDLEGTLDLMSTEGIEVHELTIVLKIEVFTTELLDLSHKNGLIFIELGLWNSCFFRKTRWFVAFLPLDVIHLVFLLWPSAIDLVGIHII